MPLSTVGIDALISRLEEKRQAEDTFHIDLSVRAELDWCRVPGVRGDKVKVEPVEIRCEDPMALINEALSDYLSFIEDEIEDREKNIIPCEGWEEE